LNEYQAECFEIALKGGYTLLDMINDLLDISKLEDGSLRLEYGELQPSVILERSVQQVMALATTSN